MSKRSFVLFGIFAVAFGLLLPYWAISKEGEEGASPEAVASSDEEAKELFQTNCGACHTLARGGTDGIVGRRLRRPRGGSVAALRSLTPCARYAGTTRRPPVMPCRCVNTC
jgi:mono/diheme cytochrome c family protein